MFRNNKRIMYLTYSSDEYNVQYPLTFLRCTLDLCQIKLVKSWSWIITIIKWMGPSCQQSRKQHKNVCVHTFKERQAFWFRRCKCIYDNSIGTFLLTNYNSSQEDELSSSSESFSFSFCISSSYEHFSFFLCTFSRYRHSPFSFYKKELMPIHKTVC